MQLCHVERLALRLHDSPIGLDSAPLAFTRGGDRLITGTGNSNRIHQAGELKMWDLQSGRPAEGFTPSLVPGVMALAISADGTRIATSHVTPGHPIELWETRTGRQLGSLPSRPQQERARSLVFSPDGG